MQTDAGSDDLSALGLLDEPVRRRLYDWVISRREPVGREEAAKALGITRALATFHLDRLSRAGLLESDYRRLTGRTGPGAGRPARVYWRAQRDIAVSLPERRYDRAAELFATALEKLSGETPPPVLREVALEFGAQLARETSGRVTSATRLERTLEHAGYQPEQDEGGNIRLRNCPFDALARRHRALVCGTNLALAEGLVAGAHAADYQPVLDPQPGFCCVAFMRDGSRDSEAESPPSQPIG